MSNMHFSSKILEEEWKSVVSDFRDFKPLTVSDVSKDIKSLEWNLRNEGVEFEYSFVLETVYSRTCSSCRDSLYLPIRRYLCWEKYGEKKTAQYRIIYKSKVCKYEFGYGFDSPLLDFKDIEERCLWEKVLLEYPDLRLEEERFNEKRKELEHQFKGYEECDLNDQLEYHYIDLNDSIVSIVSSDDFMNLKGEDFFLFNAPLDDMSTEIRMRVHSYLAPFLKALASSWKLKGYRKFSEGTDILLPSNPSMFFVEKAQREIDVF